MMDEEDRRIAIIALKDMADLAIPYGQAVKAYYDGLIVAGFTPEQAMKITCAHGFMPPLQNQEEQ